MRRPKLRYARLTLGTAMLLVPFAARSWAQTPAKIPAKIIAQYLRAKGGAKALARIHSTRIEGTVTESPGGRTGSYLLVLQSPDHLLVKESEADPTRPARSVEEDLAPAAPGRGDFHPVSGPPVQLLLAQQTQGPRGAFRLSVVGKPGVAIVSLGLEGLHRGTREHTRPRSVFVPTRQAVGSFDPPLAAEIISE